MTIATKTVEHLLYLMDVKYPDWSGFEDPRYLKDEVEYKKDSIQLAKELLAENELQQLIAAGKYQEVIDRLDKVGKDNNLLWLRAPSSGDLNILYEEDLDQESFSKAVLELLYGEGSPAELVQAYSEFIDRRDWPNKWTFPTYFRFLLHPKTDFFVKPQATKWYLKTLGSEVDLGNDPDGDVYQELLDKVNELKGQLYKYGPENLVDIQSLLWIAYRTDQQLEMDIAEPFSTLFSSRREVEWAFDFLLKASEFLGVSGSDDRLASFTLRDRGRERLLRLNFGNWLVIGFTGTEEDQTRMQLALRDHPEDVDILEQSEFAINEGEQRFYLYEFYLNDVIDRKTNLEGLIQSDFEIIKDRFSHWKASPYLNYQVDMVADAVFNESKREQLLRLGVKPLQQRFWKISPGANAWNWENCLEGGYIAVGWGALGDLSGFSREEFEIRREQYIERDPDTTEEALEQVWKFSQFKDGDRIVANRGTKEVLGIGTVTGTYYYEKEVRHPHRLPVKWDEVGVRKVDQAGWKRALIELDEDKFEIIEKQQIETQIDKGESPFSEKTFELLGGIYKNPTKEFYDQHKEDFKEYVESPFKDLMNAVAEKLPAPILRQMETEKRLFSRFLKNDFGQGGAWSHYWGAFYPKGSKRTEDAQLIMLIKHAYLEAGFFIANYAPEEKERFSRNCQKHYQSLISLLKDSLTDDELSFGPYQQDSEELEEYGEQEFPDWRSWLKNPRKWDYRVPVVLPKSLVLSLSWEELIERITRIYTNLFPLVLLTVSDDPLPLIGDYLGEEDEDWEINPEYSLADCSRETYFEEELLERWVRAIKRKKQAVFYGPPGTGKTFVAEKLADHLIGGGNGFKELVQFHPAYAYEDFMQGIRPQTLEGGGLTYIMKSGRFLEFCTEARRREGICVLIIDEINRANLSRVFGELMYLLEYRERKISLAGGRLFEIPENVRIIGTMNTADRSIALVDHALRRRFAFLGLYPNYHVLEAYHRENETGFEVDGLIGVLEELNLQISDRNYHVGITYFLQEDLADQVEDIWRMEIEPYLEEYFFDEQDKVKKFRWENIGQDIIG